MKKYSITFFLFLVLTTNLRTQPTAEWADSLRKTYHVPELGYAVVSSEGVKELFVLGEKKAGTKAKADINDRFRIGSNTKAITGFVAALLVKQNKIGWDTRFFDLFPELKAKSDPAYHSLTLVDLLSFRTRLFPYTYTYERPYKDQFKGNAAEQRYAFAAWFFQQEPVQGNDSIHFSNLAYVAAGLMLEKASGKPYEQLIKDLGNEIGIKFEYGTPNATDSLQPWGHDQALKPEAPGEQYKLNWLMAAGNIQMSLPDYARFIEIQLNGLKGKSTLLTAEEFNFLYFGRNRFAIGWFWDQDENGVFSYNIGNPGTFLSKVYVIKNADLAFIFLTNAQTAETNTCIDLLYQELKIKYGLR